jgi:putative transposase
MTIKIRREYNKTVNYKRIYRLMQITGLKSVCRKKRYNYIKSTPKVTAQNILARVPFFIKNLLLTNGVLSL